GVESATAPSLGPSGATGDDEQAPPTLAPTRHVPSQRSTLRPSNTSQPVPKVTPPPRSVGARDERPPTAVTSTSSSETASPSPPRAAASSRPSPPGGPLSSRSPHSAPSSL